jgi:hypothetical protein
MISGKGNKPVRFYYLGNILDQYYYFYQTIPYTWKELELFAENMSEKFPDDYYYYDLLKAYTFPLVRKYRKSLHFRENDCAYELWMEHKEDTLLLYNTEVTPCCKISSFPLPEERQLILRRSVFSNPRVYDENGKVIFLTDEQSEGYQESMRTISGKHTECLDRDSVIFIKYQAGLYSDNCTYCDIDMHNEYRSDIRKLIESFCQDNGAYRVLFYIYKEKEEYR